MMLKKLNCTFYLMFPPIINFNLFVKMFIFEFYQSSTSMAFVGQSNGPVKIIK